MNQGELKIILINGNLQLLWAKLYSLFFNFIHHSENSLVNYMVNIQLKFVLVEIISEN